ncbi:hypothetical protein [Polyangium aurulentum]|uniref:hypothetical protein n=1 Tax=Polyangium aurulentum TaxID=2567896 RepID=UPI0010AE5C0F|nr:hypothetical protein [Polyangium aurulentum]UQA54574.1 hypothetical protein E8A73_024700 [Polyangium aurulentum]
MKPPEENATVHQEEDTLPPRLIVYTLLATVGFAFALGLVSWRIQVAREGRLRASRNFPERYLGPIQERSNVHEELFTNRGGGQVLMHAQRQQLGQFAWVDPERRIVRVPIDVAMDLVASEGADQ